ncbi:hypothetical protein M9Y10_037493 [Tritrichomonas musculus]|uniref:Protein kinase domain-containing protein n=1 Tax=Tritrichomonas musculus TaxID=1915356 RepID=A0ABR2GRL2_9EUKA
MDFSIAESSFFNTSAYQLTNQIIGKGSSYTVKLIKDMFNGELFAAKIIDFTTDFDGEAQMRFMRQPAILQKLHHPAIVKFYGINFHSFDHSKQFQPTLLLEYLSKGSLKEMLDKEKKSAADDEWNSTKKCIVLLGITHAMKYIHQKGIIHRNLNPSNILLDDNYYPRVSGFGLSRAFPHPLDISMKLDMSGNSGTLLYMAPELLNDDIQYGIGVDIYAFSILAYEVITGKDPYDHGDKHVFSISQDIISGDRPNLSLDDITDPMKDLLLRCWSEDVADRPSFDEIFKTLSSDFKLFINHKVDEKEILDYIQNLNKTL